MNFNVNILLDRSGSMTDRKSDHIGGLKSFIEDNKDGNTKISLIQFDDINPCEILLDNMPSQDIDLSKVDLIPRGWTPLYDAIGKTIAFVESNISKEDKDTQVILVIITDGEENASKEWTSEKIRNIIKQKEKDWKILYLGANVDAFKESGRVGISQTSAVNYTNTARGVQNVYSVSTSKLRAMKAAYSQGIEKTSAMSMMDFDDDDREILN